jgi:hypothetical protein
VASTSTAASYDLDDAPMANEIRLLLQAALVLFVITVVIGILNGADVVDFSHTKLMTHVHAGTLGWITLSALAASLWLFGGGEFSQGQQQTARYLAYGAALFVPLYVAAFFSTEGIMRPIIGACVMTVFFVFFGWVFARLRVVEMTVPHLGILAAVTSSAVGAILGVLLGLQLARGERVLPEGGEDAHPAMMVIGFLVPIAMSLSEWALRNGKGALPLTTAGKVQIALPFAGGLMVMFGLLLDLVPLVALSLPFEIVGVGIYIKRLWPDLSSLNWARDIGRFSAVTAVALPLDILWFAYMLQKYEGDFDLAPQREILALDHLLFIGAITNSVFALMSIATFPRRELWSWVDSVVLVGVNVPLALFWIGLVSDSDHMIQMATPIMGTCILLALLTFTLRLQSSRGMAVATSG